MGIVRRDAVLLLLGSLAGCSLIDGLAEPPADGAPGDPGDPVGLRDGVNGSGYGADGIAPGEPFTWLIWIENRAEMTATVDGFELIDASPGLRVQGAAALPDDPEELRDVAVGMPVTSDLADVVAARPLAGSTIEPKGANGWQSGGELVFILSVPANASYSVSGIELSYTVGVQRFRTTIPGDPRRLRRRGAGAGRGVPVRRVAARRAVIVTLSDDRRSDVLFPQRIQLHVVR